MQVKYKHTDSCMM